MAISYTNYHCNACPNGIVMVKRKRTGRRVDFFFMDCNVCKKPFGLKKVEGLKLVINKIQEVPSE